MTGQENSANTGGITSCIAQSRNDNVIVVCKLKDNGYDKNNS